MLKHLQRKSIALLQEGEAAVVVGRVKPIAGVPTLRSPVTGTECLGYHVDVREVALDNVYGHRQVSDHARCVDVEVEDETGTLRVSAEKLELAITEGLVSLWDPPLPPHIQMLAVGYPGAVIVEEGLLLPGALLLVCGVAQRELGATDYRDGKSMLVLRASPTFPLVASTDADLRTPGDRPIAPEELRRGP